MSLHLAPPDSRLADAVALEGWLDDERTNQALGYGSGEKGAQNAYSSFLEAFKSGSLFSVVRGQEPIGFVVIQEPTTGLAVFHGFVAPRYRKTILAARAIEAVKRATLGNGTYRLETEVLIRNEPVIRLLKGLGFRPEGVHKARHLMDGKRENTVSLRLLRTEWRH